MRLPERHGLQLPRTSCAWRSSSCACASSSASAASCASTYGASFSSRNLAKFMIALRLRRSRAGSGLQMS